MKSFISMSPWRRLQWATDWPLDFYRTILAAFLLVALIVAGMRAIEFVGQLVFKVTQ